MRIFKYFLVGGTAAVVDIGLFSLFAIYLGWNYLAVGAASFLVATYVNYELSIRHVFQSGARFARNTEILAVFVVSGIGLILNQLVLYMCVDWLEIHKFLAKLCATGSVFFWNYLARARFVFKGARGVTG